MASNLTTTHQRLQESSNETRIKEISYLINKWKVKMSRGEGVQKGKDSLTEGGSQKKKREKSLCNQELKYLYKSERYIQ